MVFDTKINNENLTKCLQTLKELYHDLEEAGVTCENEHEFRAYMVLMNLNSGDALRQDSLSPPNKQQHQLIIILYCFN